MACIEERVSKSGKTSFRGRVSLKNHPSQTATFPTRQECKIWCQQTETDIRRGIYFKNTHSHDHTFDELIKHYFKTVVPHLKDQQNRVLQLCWWQQHLKNIPLKDINAPLIANIRDNQLSFKNEKPLNPATVNRYLSSLSAVLSYAINELEWLEDNPMRKITKRKEPNPRVRYLNTDELEILLTTAKQSRNKQLYSIIVLACSSGMRLGEILKLKFSDLNLEEGYAMLKNTKNGKDRLVPLSEESLKLLISFDSSNKQRLVFCAKNCYGKPASIRNAWNKVISKTGIQNLRLHDLRHHFASMLVQNNVPLQIISELLGHSSFVQTTRYAHLNNEQLFKAVSCIDSVMFGGNRVHN